MKSLKLQHKINLALAAVFFSAFSILGYVFYQTEMQRAMATLGEKAKFVMQTTDASRRYTHLQVFPKFEQRLREGEFLPQAASSFGSAEMFKILAGQIKKHGGEQYYFTEASLKPMNQQNLANAVEVGYIRRFQADRSLKELTEIQTDPDKDDKNFLYYIRPITVYKKNCLNCHGSETEVKSTMPGLFANEDAAYGKLGGFGWEFHADEKDRAPVGIAIVKIPVASEMSRVNSRLMTLLLSLLSMFVLVFVVINVMLRKLFLAPVREITRITNKLSLGELRTHTFAADRSDEIGTLEESINRMVVSMRKALNIAAANTLSSEPEAESGKG